MGMHLKINTVTNHRKKVAIMFPFRIKVKILPVWKIKFTLNPEFLAKYVKISLKT